MIFTKNINCFLNILNAIRCTFNTKIPQRNIFQKEIQLSIWNEILRKSEKEINLHHLPLLTWMRKCSQCPKRMSRSVYFIVCNNQIYWWWHVLISTQADFQTISLCNFSLGGDYQENNRDMLNPWTSNIIQFIFDGWVSLWVEICELITDLLWWVDYFPMENYSCIWSPLFLYLVWANPTNIPISGNTVPGTFIMLWL